MKILYLAHRRPYPPDKGERIRAYHHLRHLASRHEVHLVSFCARDEVDSAGGLAGLCRTVELVPLHHPGALARGVARLGCGGAFSSGYFGTAAMRRAVQRAVAAAGGVDLAWTSSVSLAQHLPQVAGVRQVVDFIDVDSEKWREYAHRSRAPIAWAYAVEAARLARVERQVAACADQALLVSESEAVVLRAAVPAARVRVIPNGVDTAFFQPRPEDPCDGSLQLVFIGSLDYRPNVDAVTYFVREVLPRLRGQVPNLGFTAVGHRPAAGLIRTVARAGEGVRIAGSVADVRPYLAAARLCVVPLRFGRGIKNKVLEAMAMGRAVVASSVAVQDLAVRDGVHLRIANDAQSCAAAVLDLARDAVERRRLAANALRLVREAYQWESAFRSLDACIDALVRETA
jgi:sugar transferase (PEP-CTERM/EpsH1 system associated)